MGMMGWLKRRVARAIQQEVAQQTTRLREDVEALRVSIEPEWINHVNLMLSDVSRHLNAIDQLSQKNERTDTEMISRLWSLEVVVNNLKNEVAPVERINAEFAVLESRVRANPYRVRDLDVSSSKDGRNTLGYDTQKGGTYADFIDMFRPDFDVLVNQLKYVLSWLPRSGKAVDLGAGRGEMVTVLKNHGLDVFGIDSDQSVVDEAQSRGINIRLQGITDFLKLENSQQYDVVTAIHVVEHVAYDILEDWLRGIHKTLKPGGVFVAETPNPHAIDAFKAFWVDVTHVRPYYPESLLHMVLSACFKKAEIWVDGEQQLVSDRLGYAGAYTIIATA
jgi:2-polyprenyl-3-methyl-5-hydroxy-6-metoxy-1,4-benzoquinol methylase